jgi:acyl carrier protein
MTREEIINEILIFFRKEFEIENPGLDDDLRELYDFDSIDAIDLLIEIESWLGTELTHEEKKKAMEIRTINHICHYIETLISVRSAFEK